MKNVDKIINRLRYKQKLLAKRAGIAQGLSQTPGFENLDLSKLPDLLTLIKANRWNLHGRAAELNLNISKRRNHLTQPSNLQRFSGQSDTYLSCTRAALMIYSGGSLITAAGICRIVKGVNIHRATVYKFLRDAVDGGIYEEVENDGGAKAYRYTDLASEDQFENLLELIFNPVTFHYVQSLHRIYGMTRLSLNSEFRREPTSTESFLDMLDEDAADLITDLSSGVVPDDTLRVVK